MPLSWFATDRLWCAIDSWIRCRDRQPRVPSRIRRTARRYAVPVLVVGVIVRMITAETLDFSLVLLLLSIGTGLVWLHRPPGLPQAARSGRGRRRSRRRIALPEPGTVDYARSFFPVAFIVLIVRAFIFEPFRIPSDSMMPTLLDGDFIVVNKFAYGLRWPVVNQKFLDTGSPQRGDVVVFRYPPNPSINYIKRLVGLPGDRVEVHDDHLVINGETIALAGQAALHRRLLLQPASSVHRNPRRTHAPGHVVPLGLRAHRRRAICWLARQRRFSAGLRSQEDPRVVERLGLPVRRSRSARARGFAATTVRASCPAGHYLMIGDNRDNSEDSRSWGLVPDKNLVGKATRIWFNFDLQRASVVNWSRIGDGIQ